MVETDINTNAETYKYLTVYPSALAGTWNLGYGFGADDVGFIRALITELGANWNVDTDNCWATGHSQGADMVQYFAATETDLFQGYGVVCVGINDRIDHVTGGFSGGVKPFVFYYNEDDPNFAYAGDDNHQSAQYTIGFWAGENGTTMGSYTTVSGDTDGYSVTTATSADNSILVYIGSGGSSHGWPPNYGDAIWPQTEADLNLSDLMTDFFATKGL